MNRRQILEWLSRGLATLVAAVVGLPGVRFFMSGANTAAEVASPWQRMKRLQDLPLGRPVLVPVVGSKQDGWTKSDQQVLGRVWLVRNTAESETPVQGFTSVCPHMGCQIQAQASNQGFICPCHRAAFGLDGARQADPRTGDRNHAPRNMDVLPCRIATDPESGDLWVEIQYARFETGREQPVILT